MINEKRITLACKTGHFADGAVDVMVTVTPVVGPVKHLEAIITFGERTVSIYQINSFREFIRMATYSRLTLERHGLIVNGLVDVTELLLFDAQKADDFFCEDEEIYEKRTWVDAVEVQKRSRGKVLDTVEYLGGFTTLRDVLCGCYVAEKGVTIILDTL